MSNCGRWASGSLTLPNMTSAWTTSCPVTRWARTRSARSRRAFAKRGRDILAFTSLNGGRKVMGPRAVAGEQPERLGETRVFILPSPSPLAANHWDITPWRDLAKAVDKLKD